LFLYFGGVLEDLEVLAAIVSALSAVVGRCTACSCLELVCELQGQVFSKGFGGVLWKILWGKDICFGLGRREINDRVSDAYRGEDEQGREMAFRKVYI
jgi:hypothetical protein